MAPKPLPRVAICTVLRNERRYILEWIAHHRRLGVSRFLIFDNDSDDGSQQLLAALQAQGVVNVLPWPGRGIQRQLDAFLAGANALRLQCDFVAFIDLDEFLILDDGESLPGLLARLPADVGALVVCQRVFGSSHRSHYEPDLVTSRFTLRAPNERDEHRWYKTIARPEFVLYFVSPHAAQLSFGRQRMTDGGPVVTTTHAGAADRISHGQLHINHYMLKSREEFADKQRRGAFADALETARLADGYFTGRDPGCNAVTDLQAADSADALRADILAIAQTLPDAVRRRVHEDLGLNRAAS